MTIVVALRSLLTRAARRLRHRPSRSALLLSQPEFCRLLTVPGLPASQTSDANRLAAHFLERSFDLTLTFPRHIAEQSGMAAADARTRADAIANCVFEHSNQPPVTFDAGVDWQYDPTGDPRKRWARALSRHLWIPLLVAAYQETRDERYARAFVDLISSWIVANPLPSSRDESSIGWNLMNVGIRCMIWPVAFLAFQGSPCFKAVDQIRVLQSLLDHGRFLSRFQTHGNHLLRETNGLANLAGWFPEFREATQWRDTALARLTEQLIGQINPDGSHYELSTAYQWMVIEEFESTREILDRFGWALSDVDLEAVLARMYRWLRALRTPAGTWPPLNDGFFDAWSNYSARLSRADGLFPAEDACESLYLADAGIAVMRSTRSIEPSDEHYLMVEAGPYGGLHGHEDQLGFELHLGSQPFLVDPGTYTYNATDPFRGYFVSSQAHNTLTVDGKSQSRRYLPEHRRPQKTLADVGSWLTHPKYDLFSARYTAGYAPFRLYPQPVDRKEIDSSVEHIRSVLYVRDDYWLVIDDLVARGNHVYVRHFQCAEGIRVIRVEGVAVLLSGTGKPALYLIPAESASRISIPEGELNPIAGWVSNGRLGHKVAAPQVQLHNEAEGSTRLITLLMPCDKGSLASITPISLSVHANDCPDDEFLQVTVDVPKWTDRLTLSGYWRCASAGIRIERDTR